MNTSNAVNIASVLSDAARTWPSVPAVLDEAGTMSFAELHSTSENIAQFLRTQGVRRGQGVALIAKNGRSFIAGLFAIVSLQAVAVPFSDQIRSTELQSALKEISVSWILTDAVGSKDLPAPSTTIATNSIRLQLHSRPVSEILGALVPIVPDAAFIRHTSGTTGKSKGVVISHRSAFERIKAAQEALQIVPGERIAWVLPMAYHFVVSIVLYVQRGACVVVCNENDPALVAQTVVHKQCSLVYAAPTMYRLLSVLEEAPAFKNVRLAISTSSKLSPFIADLFLQKFGIPVSQFYGVIEIGLVLGNVDHCRNNPDSVGRALPGYQVEIVDDQGHILKPGMSGNLAVRGPGMFDAYTNPLRSRDEVLVLGWFLTGDIAKKDLSGMIQIEGRRGSCVNFQGKSIFPEQIEAVIETHAEIKEAHVFGKSSKKNGFSLLAEVVPKHPGINIQEVAQYCRERLPAEQVPSEFKVVSSIQLTKSGKVVRHTIQH